MKGMILPLLSIAFLIFYPDILFPQHSPDGINEIVTVIKISQS